MIRPDRSWVARERLGIVLVLCGVLVASSTLVAGVLFAPQINVAGTSAGGSTLVGTQGAQVSEGSVVLLDRHGEIAFERTDAVSYHDVSRLPNGTILAAYIDDGYTECGPYDSPCSRTGYRIIDPNSNTILREWNYPVRTGLNSEVHDVELLPSGEMLVVGMDRERVFTVAENGTVTWTWNASEFYDSPPDPTRTDWLHMNDVDRIGPGRYLVSVRNVNQLLILERGSGVVEVVNEDRDKSVLNHQHNPQYIDSETVLVADSENDRVVELEKDNGTWEVGWAIDSAGGIGFNWPRDADRLANGNTLITDSRNNRIVEVNRSGAVVWSRGVPNLPYEADRLPDEEANGTISYTDGSQSVQQGTQGADTTFDDRSASGGVSGGIVSTLESLVGMLRHAIALPYWVTWWVVPGLFGSTVLAIGGVTTHAYFVGFSTRGTGLGRVRRYTVELSSESKYAIAVGAATVTLVITSPVSWNYFDVHLFMLTWNDQFSNGWNVYASGNSNYPPLATYLFVALEELGRATAKNPIVEHTALTEVNWLRFVARVPLVLAYLATGHLLYRRWEWSVARYWLLTPPALLGALLVRYHFAFASVALLSWTALIPLNTFWGYQFDLLAVPLTLLACYSLLDERPERFGLYVAMGAMVKFYPAVLLPLGLARFSLQEQARATAVFGLIVGLVSIPFVLTAPGEYYYQLLGFQSSRFPQGLSPFHVPLLLFGYDTARFASVSFLKWFWQLLWIPLYGYIVLSAWTTEDDETLVLAIGAALLSLVALNKIGNLNYLVWPWPFLLFALDREYVSRYLPTGFILTSLSYVLTIQIPAAITDEKVLVIQELKWYNARDLLVLSYRGAAQPMFIEQLRSLNRIFGGLATDLYSNRFPVLIAIVAIHTFLLGALLWKLNGSIRNESIEDQLTRYATRLQQLAYAVRDGRTWVPTSLPLRSESIRYPAAIVNGLRGSILAPSSRHTLRSAQDSPETDRERDSTGEEQHLSEHRREHHEGDRRCHSFELVSDEGGRYQPNGAVVDRIREHEDRRRWEGGFESAQEPIGRVVVRGDVATYHIEIERDESRGDDRRDRETASVGRRDFVTLSWTFRR